jgi:hypothetical protein
VTTKSDKIETTDEVCDYLQIPFAQLRAPLSRLQAASHALGTSPHADLLRMDACHRIRLAQDGVFAAGSDPVPLYATVSVPRHSSKRRLRYRSQNRRCHPTRVRPRKT